MYVKQSVQRLSKYLLEGLVVALVAYWIPNMRLLPKEIIIISLTASSTFAVLDYFAPTFSSSARTGTGLGIGLRLGGF